MCCHRRRLNPNDNEKILSSECGAASSYHFLQNCDWHLLSSLGPLNTMSRSKGDTGHVTVSQVSCQAFASQGRLLVFLRCVKISWTTTHGCKT
jgi:hypothetical protein